MHQAKLKSIRGYMRPRYKSGKPSIAAPNRLQQQFIFNQRCSLGDGYHPCEYLWTL